MSANGNRSPHVEVRVTHRFRATTRRVFDAWLDPTTASTWLFATASHPIARAEIDARVGGAFSFLERRDGAEIEYRGEYVEIVPARRLVFMLAMENSPKVITRVIAEIVPLKTGCELTLTHENVPPEHTRRIEGRWTGMLYGLDVTLGRAYQSAS